MEYNYIGIDISKDKFDAYWNTHHWQIRQTYGEITTFLEKISTLVKKANSNPLLFVCEPSGGYERRFVLALRKSGLNYHVAHANKVKAFARAKGYLAKTDKIDARIISEYAQLMKIEPDEIKLSENKEKIADLVKRREQLMQDKRREKNRFDKLVDEQVIGSQEAHVKWLNKEIEKIESELDKLGNDSKIKPDVDLFTSMPGIGKLSALYLIAFLPELGEITHKQLAALVGVAPYNHDSGKYRGKRHIHGGRQVVRRILYIAAFSAIKWNAELKAFYEQLVNRGKPAKVAIVAVIRKMLSTLNTMMQHQTKWVKKEQFIS